MTMDTTLHRLGTRAYKTRSMKTLEKDVAAQIDTSKELPFQPFGIQLSVEKNASAVRCRIPF
jgi:hypothetical protein